ncbi:MAG: hypothetical protein JJU21_10970 [Salinarimonas sp.]|nr:hypothetical protein [Salinarimonas sp.]
MSLKKEFAARASGPSDDAPEYDCPAVPAPRGNGTTERAALLQALARRDECLARKRDYIGRSAHVRRKLDAALRAAESDVAILRYALGESADTAPGDDDKGPA